MKKNQLEETRKKSVAEITTQLTDLQKSLIDLKMQLKKGNLTNKKEPRIIRRSIAQLKTILKEKSILEEAK